MKRFVQYHGGHSAIEECEADAPSPQCFTCSKPYETEAELRERRHIHPEPCRHCGCPFTVHYVEEVKKRLIEEQRCHSCDHWIGIIEGPVGLRVKGQHYRALPDKPKVVVNNFMTQGREIEVMNFGQGHGGREFHIRMLDSTDPFTSRNLWHQGVIPQRFREQLPDNAEFVQRPEPVSHGKGYLA